MIEVLKKLLSEYLSRAEWIEVYSKLDNTSSFVVGQVLFLDEEYVLLGLIHPSGVYDGYLILKLDKIYQIKEKSGYISRLQLLEKMQEKIEFKISMSKDNLLYNFLHICKKNQWIVSVEINNSDYNDIIGQVYAVDEKTAEILEITDDGKEDGKSILDLENITRVSADDLNGRKIQLFSRYL